MLIEVFDEAFDGEIEVDLAGNGGLGDLFAKNLLQVLAGEGLDDQAGGPTWLDRAV